MLKLYLCDDAADSRALLTDYSRQLLAQEDLPPVKICTFSSAEELLSCEEDPDILLLDVQMEGMSGLEAARILRRRGCRAFLILVTNYVQYAIDGYEVQAFHFLKKPVSYDRFSLVLKQALSMADRRKHACLSVKADDALIRIPTHTILYCETDHNAVRIHTQKDCIRCYSSMAALESELAGQDFYRCHTAYLLNLAAVERLLPTSVLLSDGTDIPVSKHRKKEFREKLAAYWGDTFL